MRLGERSLRMALASIWRMRSRVTCTTPTAQSGADQVSRGTRSRTRVSRVSCNSACVCIALRRLWAGYITLRRVKCRR
jgi:hypothetical protein